MHEFRVSANAEKKEKKEQKAARDAALQHSRNYEDPEHLDVPLLQQDVDPTGLSSPLPAGYTAAFTSSKVYEDAGSTHHSQNTAIMAQQQDLLRKLDVLVGLMSRDMAARGIK